MKIADEQGVDLVKISPQATPPVCKLMNYGKFRFEQSKREKEAKKNQHIVEIKEIRMGLTNTPLLPVSTGTNNVYPDFVEGTVAGMSFSIFSIAAA